MTTTHAFYLATEAAQLERSVMRRLLKFAVAPKIISLAGGLPADDLLPTEQFAECLAAVLERDGSTALQYGPVFAPLQAWIAEYMHSRGVACTPEQVFLTNGAQQGLSILSRLFLDPGDHAVTEAITFTGIRQVTAGRGMTMHTIPTDLEFGADMDALQSALETHPTPRMAVLIPDFHNPLGVSMNPERRERAAALAAEFGVPLVEDDPYSALRFGGKLPAPIKAYDDSDSVFYVGSFSKILAPAVRLGWIIAPLNLVPNIQVLRESFDLESSSLMQRAVFEFLDRGLLQPHLERLICANRVRRDTMLAALEEHLGDIASWSHPQGGLFTWVKLPEEINTEKLFPAAIEQKVAYIPGNAFAVVGGSTNAMRLNFSSAPPADIRTAVERLANVIRQDMAMPDKIITTKTRSEVLA